MRFGAGRAVLNFRDEPIQSLASMECRELYKTVDHSGSRFRHHLGWVNGWLGRRGGIACPGQPDVGLRLLAIAAVEQDNSCGRDRVQDQIRLRPISSSYDVVTAGIAASVNHDVC